MAGKHRKRAQHNVTFRATLLAGVGIACAAIMAMSSFTAAPPETQHQNTALAAVSAWAERVKLNPPTTTPTSSQTDSESSEDSDSPGRTTCKG